jgi:hypothetical protein
VRCPPKASKQLGIRPGDLYFQELTGELLKMGSGGPPGAWDCPSDEGCWVREGAVEAELSGYQDPDSGTWLIPPANSRRAATRIFGEARAEGERFFILFNRLRLADGEVFPMCALGTYTIPGTSIRNEVFTPYYEIIGREKGRVLVRPWAHEFKIYPLEEF